MKVMASRMGFVSSNMRLTISASPSPAIPPWRCASKALSICSYGVWWSTTRVNKSHTPPKAVSICSYGVWWSTTRVNKSHAPPKSQKATNQSINHVPLVDSPPPQKKKKKEQTNTATPRIPQHQHQPTWICHLKKPMGA